MSDVQSAGKSLFALLLETASKWLNHYGAPIESADYEEWRQQFLMSRLQLSCRLMFYWSLSWSAFLIVVHSSYTAHLYWLTRDIAALASLSLCLVLQKTRLGRTHGEALFLGLCLSMTWFTELATSLLGSTMPDVPFWTVVFLTLAAVIPVRWQLHLTAQLSVLVSYFAINALLGQSFKAPLAQQISVWLCLFWVCFICDFAVYLYERLRRAEFAASRELRSFIQTVSQDLRTPALSSLEMLTRLLDQPGKQIAISHSTLEELQTSSDRQLTLIESLLERARHAANTGTLGSNPPQIFDQAWLTKDLKAVRGLLESLKSKFDSVFTKTVATAASDAKLPFSSMEYKAWRYQFLMERLPLVAWIALIADVTLSLPTIYEATLNPSITIQISTYGVVIVCLLLWFLFYKSSLGRKQPGLLFLSLATSLTVVVQLYDSIIGFREPEFFVWTLVFVMMATLVPVCWRLHLLAQLITIASYSVMLAVWGLSPILELSHLLGMLWYVVWICFICNLGVYTYEQLQRSEFESRRQLRLFLHSIAHDLRTPVLGTAMVLNNLLNKAQDTIFLPRSVLERIVQGGDRQLRLINSLLEAHASLDQGITCSCKPTQLKLLVQAIVADVEPLLVQGRATLTDLVPKELPLVNADSTQLWRVFENLITNALKYNPPGVHLTIQATIDHDCIRCSVQDDGVGISPELRAQIFELYSRGLQVRRSPGLGLGLYLCRQIITAHGGEIGVISTPGAGTTFWFTLPIASTQASLISQVYESS